MKKSEERKLQWMTAEFLTNKKDHHWNIPTDVKSELNISWLPWKGHHFFQIIVALNGLAHEISHGE